jgi:hypothetical protein
MLKSLEIVAVLAAIVFAVALAGLIVMYSSQPSNEPEQQQQSEKHEPSQEKREYSKSFWQRTTQDPIAFFTLWLAIFGNYILDLGSDLCHSRLNGDGTNDIRSF